MCVCVCVCVCIEPPAKFFKREVLTGPQLLEGVAFLREGCYFYINYKLKSEIFNDQKSL